MLVAALLSFLCSACSTASINTADVVNSNDVAAPEFLSPSHGAGKVVIVRANPPLAPCAHHFTIDGVEVVTLHPGQKAELYVAPGLHAVNMDFSNACGGQPVHAAVNVTTNGVVIHDEMKSGYYTLRDYPLEHG